MDRIVDLKRVSPAEARHPGGYAMFADVCPATYPSVRRPTSTGIEPALIAAAARRSGIEVVSEEHGRVIARAGRVANEPYQRRRESVHIRFFEATNPRYAARELLGVCVPPGAWHLVRGVLLNPLYPVTAAGPAGPGRPAASAGRTIGPRFPPRTG